MKYITLDVVDKNMQMRAVDRKQGYRVHVTTHLTVMSNGSNTAAIY